MNGTKAESMPFFADFPLISRPFPTPVPSIILRIASLEHGRQTVRIDVALKRLDSKLSVEARMLRALGRCMIGALLLTILSLDMELSALDEPFIALVVLVEME